jgi:hypothetical protein
MTTEGKEKWHTGALDTEINRAHASIKESMEKTLKELLRLQKIVVRPGWTTPAEFLFARGGINSAAARALAIASDVATLVDVSDKVGQASGVVIIEG